MKLMHIRPHQQRLADEGYRILKENGLCYNDSEERTGKSLTTLLIFLKTIRHHLLIITKKKAITDWQALINLAMNGGIEGVEWPDDKAAVVINYESLHKITIKPDIVALDEAHNFLSKFPKPGKRFMEVGNLVYGLPLMYLSATLNHGIPSSFALFIILSSTSV